MYKCSCVYMYVYVCISRRHRMSEADEDDELLDDDLGEKVITRFSENPWCEYCCPSVV